MNEIYITDEQNMFMDMVYAGKDKEEIKNIIDDIFSRLDLGMEPGSTLIGDTIVGDKYLAARWETLYDIKMLKIDLYHNFDSDKVKETSNIIVAANI